MKLAVHLRRTKFWLMIVQILKIVSWRNRRLIVKRNKSRNTSEKLALENGRKLRLRFRDKLKKILKNSKTANLKDGHQLPDVKNMSVKLFWSYTIFFVDFISVFTTILCHSAHYWSFQLVFSWTRSDYI